MENLICLCSSTGRQSREKRGLNSPDLKSQQSIHHRETRRARIVREYWLDRITKVGDGEHNVHELIPDFKPLKQGNAMGNISDSSAEIIRAKDQVKVRKI